MQKKKKNENKEEAGKSKSIRVYFTNDQKIKLNKWFGVKRWIYNKCLDAIKNRNIPATKKDLREHVIKNKNFETENTWMLNYEFDLRDEAMSDLLYNIKSNLAKGTKFNIQFKSKKNSRTESLSVLSKKWNKKNNFYSDIFRPDRVLSSEKLPDSLLYTSRLKKTQTNKYYFCIPESLIINSENQANKKIIFIDPGVKTFITGYDPEGKIIIWGERDVGMISRLIHYKNKLQGRIATEKSKKRRYRMKKAFLRMNERIFNLVDELHKKLTKWLINNYSYIFIPKLNFHKIKNMDKKSKCKMASLRHCSFVDRLKNKTRENPGVFVLEVKEDYTSITCSECGSLHSNLKNKDIYYCSSCNKTFGRDINASKNIMLKFFTERALTSVGS